MEQNLSESVNELRDNQKSMEQIVTSIQKSSIDNYKELQQKMTHQQDRHNQEMKTLMQNQNNLLEHVSYIKKYMQRDQKLRTEYEREEAEK